MFGRRARQQPATPPLHHAHEPRSDRDVVGELARQHLPAHLVPRWLELLRPAAHLMPAGPGDEIAARLGGEPSLPTDLSWPTWDGCGPLSYIGELFCTPLANAGLDITLPGAGRLQFFYYDGAFDDGATIVGTWDVATLAGARVIYIADEVETAVRTTPQGLRPYPSLALTAHPIVTYPGFEHPVLQAAFRANGESTRSFLDHPVTAAAFTQALRERLSEPLHQVGGYADTIQGPVEFEVAQAALNNEVPYGDPALQTEAARWTLLFQVDTDGRTDMIWGDSGVLYWMARPEDLNRGDLGRVSFTWQCS